MKTYITLFFLSFFLISATQLWSQNTCKVLKPEISGKYEGKCKNGLAHGKGIAQGNEKYEGRFKSGLPNGSGTYFYSTGEVYKGNWKAGKRDGKGTLYYMVNGEDCIKYGIWSKDAFFKEIELPAYNVGRTTSVSRHNITRQGDGNKITFDIRQNGASVNSYSNVQISSSSGNMFSDGLNIGVENVIFPFKGGITYLIPNSMNSILIDVEFEFELLKSGNWEIVIYN